jgi:hypothetical protein
MKENLIYELSAVGLSPGGRIHLYANTTYLKSVFSNMYHHGPSDNGSRIVNCNDNHFLNENVVQV